MKTYGEQRFLMYNEELTPEQKAKQTLAIEAIKEQARYERKKRRELANKVKDGVSMFTKFIAIVLLGAILAAVVGCSPEPIEECVTFDLGPVGEPYEVVPSNGLPGVIYIGGGRVKQDICPF